VQAKQEASDEQTRGAKLAAATPRAVLVGGGCVKDQLCLFVVASIILKQVSLTTSRPSVPLQ
jgi:hypothetical protein